MTGVIWKDVPGYEGHYQACTDGNVRSVTKTVRTKGDSTAVKHGKVLAQTSRKKGYLCVGLSKNGQSKVIETQRIIALTFLSNPDNLPCVNHKDEDKTNNDVNNLEWCTYKYNNEYGNRRKKVSEARINGKMSKPVIQYDTDGNFIAEYPSFAEVKRSLGYDSAKINACALGKPHRKTAYGYVWKYKDSVDSNTSGERRERHDGDAVDNPDSSGKENLLSGAKASKR